MVYHGSKPFKKPYSLGSPTSTLSSKYDKRRFPHHQPVRFRNTEGFSRKPHHEKLPLRQKAKRTAPIIEAFVPWTPESSPPPEERHVPDDDLIVTPKKRRLSNDGEKKSIFAGAKRAHPDDWYSRRAKVRKITDSTEDEATRRLKVAGWSSIVERKRQRANELRADRERMPAAAQRGMPNFTGVLCYRISLLQCLLNLPLFVNWVMDYAIPDNCVSDRPELCFTCALHDLVCEYWKDPNIRSGDKLRELFRDLHVVIGKLGWTERGQADPDEQLIFFLKRLQAELPSSIFGLIESVLQSSFAQSIPCQCGHRSTTYGTEAKFTIYLKPLLKNGTLQNYLERSLSDRVEYRCESCSTTKERPKVRRFVSTGDVVCIHISRVDAYHNKITAPANVPLVLDLSRVVTFDNAEPQKYELRSVVKHMGTADSGHYVACTVDPTSRSGGWQLFNDSSEVRKHGDEKFALGPKMGSPFLCFFQRIRK